MASSPPVSSHFPTLLHWRLSFQYILGKWGEGGGEGHVQIIATQTIHNGGWRYLWWICILRGVNVREVSIIEEEEHLTRLWTGRGKGMGSYKGIDSMRCLHLCTGHFCVLWIFLGHLPSPKMWTVDNQISVVMALKCENVRFFCIMRKEKLTELGSKPRVNELQCKLRVGTEGM